jgi:hypothetical protein
MKIASLVTTLVAAAALTAFGQDGVIPRCKARCEESRGNN